MADLVYDAFKMEGYKQQKIGVPHKDTYYYHRNRHVYIGLNMKGQEEHFLQLNGESILIVSHEIFIYYLKKDGKLMSYWDSLLEIERKRIHNSIDNYKWPYNYGTHSIEFAMNNWEKESKYKNNANRKIT